MIITSEIRFEDFKPWCGAKATFERILEEGKERDFESLIEELYPEGTSDTTINDILWFDSDWVYEALGISDEEEEE